MDEMIKEYPETHLQKPRIEIYKETIQLIKMHNEDRIHTILHFSTNIICFGILSGYSILGNEELVILNSWFQEFSLQYVPQKAIKGQALADFLAQHPSPYDFGGNDIEIGMLFFEEKIFFPTRPFF